MAAETLIVIPARYASSRFPGKPLTKIAGRTMLSRVVDQARVAAEAIPDCGFIVATDDARIADHCTDIDAACVMTDPALASGSDRARAAADLTAPAAQYIINLQGDAPFTPVSYLTGIAEAVRAEGVDVATPCIRLAWSALDALRDAKQTAPFSGTTCVMNADGDALWFSKTIIPAIRNEAALRERTALSPVCRHVGLYAFRRAALKRFTDLPPSPLEETEGLEQLRLLENGLSIRCILVDPAPISTGGIDTPEDLARLEALLAAHGDPGVLP